MALSTFALLYHPSLKCFHHPKMKACTHETVTAFPSYQPLVASPFYLCEFAYHVSGIAQCLSICVWLISRNTVSSGFMAQAVACMTILFFFQHWMIVHCMYLCICSPIKAL